MKKTDASTTSNLQGLPQPPLYFPHQVIALKWIRMQLYLLYLLCLHVFRFDNLVDADIFGGSDYHTMTLTFL